MILPLAERTDAAQSRTEAVAELHRLLANLPTPETVCSAKVVDLTTGEVLLEHDAERKLIPASNQKLWVLAAAAVDLGASFTFRTVLASQGNDLCVIGGGDPGFGDPEFVKARGESITGELERWASAVAAKGVKSLAGRLVYADTLFDRQWTHPSWEARHLRKGYAAPVSALSIGGNCVKVTLRPAEQEGDPVLWSMIPPSDAVEIVNRCVSGGEGKAVIDRPGSEMRLVISGRCNRQWEFPTVSVSDPVAFFAGAFRQALRRHGIAAEQEVRTRRVRLPNGDLPPDLTILAEHRTPLPAVLGRIGKDSQNLFTEALVKQLGFEWSRRAGWAEPIGSWDTGRLALLDFAERAHVALAESDYRDGSGLSRDNRMSAAQAVGLLSYMYQHPSKELFVNSLSVAGREGLLKRRMMNIPGAVYAKTGYLQGVRTLSGYVVTPAERWFAFSVLFNGIKGPTMPFNKIHDELCRLLSDWPES